MSYIVTIDNPYYPSVYYCETLAEAHAKSNEWVIDMHADDGQYKAHVVIAEVLEMTAIDTEY